MRLLVVDDDSEVRTFIADALEANGHSVVTVTNGVEAIAAFEKEVFHIVITDWQMPEMNGPDLCRAIRSLQLPSYIYIIMLTALYNVNNVVSGLDAGADDYLTKPFATEELCARVRVGERLLAVKTHSIVLRALTELVEFRVHEMGGHIRRVQHYSRLLAKCLYDQHHHPEVNASYIQLIYETSALHDVGKVAIQDIILRKPGKLTRAEIEVMKTHAESGRQFFSNLLTELPGAPFLEMCRDIAGSHHERWDGTGYPDGLKGSAIPLSARIMALADVYDALTSLRCYKTAINHNKSREIILNGAGAHFDPAVVTAFQVQENAFDEIQTKGIPGNSGLISGVG
ncbi:MAG: HD domain-containing phosphohydrolase [Planctomycetota bacterium]